MFIDDDGSFLPSSVGATSAQAAPTELGGKNQLFYKQAVPTALISKHALRSRVQVMCRPFGDSRLRLCLSEKL